jgi:ubiquinone/menaquinone biosynthesis C-methylase UbiE
MTAYLDFEIDWSDPDVIATYDELPLWSAQAGLLLFEHLPLHPAITALDVGPGTGFPLLDLAQRLGPGSMVVGLDPWAPALARGRLKQRAWSVHNADLVLGDAAAIPFGDRDFDLVVSNLGLNNFANAPAAVAECARVLKPDGALAITTNLRGHMRELYDALEAVLVDLNLDAASEPLRRHIEHRATIDSVRALLAAARLTVSRVEPRDVPMRFATGTALLNHHFIKRGFLDGWKAVVPENQRVRVFTALESRLNDIARTDGHVRLTIPLAYIEAAHHPAIRHQ